MNSLALNVIVGQGEADLLDRCLDSFEVNKYFDEIVIVNTSTDLEIEVLAQKYGAKYREFKWESEDFPHGNFAGARNRAVENTESQFIMWLDSDDVLLDKYIEQWEKLVSVVKDENHAHVKMYTMPYALTVRDDGSPVSSFTRERIFRSDVMKWRNPVHEMIDIAWSPAEIGEFNNIAITHLPNKPKYASAVRNLKILEHEYFTKNNQDIQVKYFLGRDYLLFGETEKGRKIFDEMIENMEVSWPQLRDMCVDMIWIYGYGNHNTRPRLSDLKMENERVIEKYARLALNFSNKISETYCVLGDLYFRRNQLDAAERMYLQAMKQDKNGGKRIQSALFYGEIPLWRLSLLYYEKHEYEKSLLYSRQWLKCTNNAGSTLALRNTVINYLMEENKKLSNQEETVCSG